jgi:hypothetical protein
MRGARPPRKTCRLRTSSAWPRSSALRGSSTTPHSLRAQLSRRMRFKPCKRALRTTRFVRQRPPTGLIRWPAIRLLWSKRPSRLQRFRDPPRRRPFRSTRFPLHPHAHHLRPHLRPRLSCQPRSGRPYLHGRRRRIGPRFLLPRSFQPSRGRGRRQPPRGHGSCEGAVLLENPSGLVSQP